MKEMFVLSERFFVFLVIVASDVLGNFFVLKASLGTTKYCSYFLKSMQCPKPDCMYLHELGDEAASFTKEEMQVIEAPINSFLPLSSAGLMHMLC